MNRQALRRLILSQVRLPISPLRHTGFPIAVLALNFKRFPPASAGALAKVDKGLYLYGMIKLLNRLLGNGRPVALQLALVSSALLVTVYYFEYVLKILPCELCYWQRKPHFAIIPLGLLAFALGSHRLRAGLLVLVAAAALGNMGISIFHVGVEYKWWPGLSGCSAPTAIATTIEEARNLIFNSTVVPCDKPGWVFLGISMAGWNGIVSLAMAVWALLGARRSWKAS